MMDVFVELVKRMFEKGEHSRKFAVTLADSYLRRSSGFQDQIVLLGITLNFLAAGYVLSFAKTCGCQGGGLIACLVIFLANMLLATLYSYEHRTTKLLFARYPELELIMAGDKSWSTSRMLARVYKLVQSAWMLYSAVLLLEHWL